MQRTFATLPLLATLALLTPVEALAGPPQGASGKMVHEVADGLRMYRKEKDVSARAANGGPQSCPAGVATR